MKKIRLYIIAALCILLLTACGKNNQDNQDNLSVGIIGGADGSTSVFVTDSVADKNPESSGESDEYEDLNNDDLLIIEAFLNRDDVYGFLLSNYDDVLDADFGQVFYDGAGVGEYPNQELRKLFLDAVGITEDEVLGDITYISAENADKVLQRVTGHKLSELWAQERDLDLYAVQDADGYFTMSGDTNRIKITALSGTRYPDGKVIVYSSSSYGDNWYDNSDSDDEQDAEALAEFVTELRETDNGFLIISNHVIGGWMAELIERRENGQESIIYAETPPFEPENVSMTVDPDSDDTMPCTMDKLSETENNGSDAQTWAATHWDEWMSDVYFAASQNGVIPMNADEDFYQNIINQPFEDRDEYYIYNYNKNAAILNIWNIYADEYEFKMDLSEYLSPNGPIDPGNPAAQNLNWARIINGVLLISNSCPVDAQSQENQENLNAYITALNLRDGSVIWRSDPMINSALNFELFGVWDNGILNEGVIVCGYGSPENNNIYQISMTSGKILSETPIASAPDAFAYANGILYVHCLDRDYEFEIAYG